MTGGVGGGPANDWYCGMSDELNGACGGSVTIDGPPYCGVCGGAIGPKLIGFAGCGSVGRFGAFNALINSSKVGIRLLLNVVASLAQMPTSPCRHCNLKPQPIRR